MKILPHDQNSGGFYVALLKKKDNFQWKYSVSKEKMQSKDEDEILELVKNFGALIIVA